MEKKTRIASVDLHPQRKAAGPRPRRLLTLRVPLLVILSVFGIIAAPAFPPVHAASGAYFDNVVIIAMENQNYASVLGTGTGSPNAPFISGLLQYGSTIPNYHSYGAGAFSGDTISGCSAACYVALISGSTQGVSDGYCCITHPTLTDSLTSTGSTWQAYCESGCPRGPDHFPFYDASGSLLPNAFASSSVSTNDFYKAATQANPPTFLWFTPTDSHNMHDNSIQSGDAYLQSFLVGTGTLANPSAGSLFSASLFHSGHRVLFWLWWDEYDPSPNLQIGFNGAQVKAGYISANNNYDEYSTLRLIENNWALPTLAANDAAAAPPTDIFGVSTSPPPTLPPSSTYTLSFQGYDFDGQNEETINMNSALVAMVPPALTPANGATWVPFSLDITSFVVAGSNTLSFTHANSDCQVLDQVRNLIIANQTMTVYSNATTENINTATNCTNTLTYHFYMGSQTTPSGSNRGNGNGSCAVCGIVPTLSSPIGLLAISGLFGLAITLALSTIRSRAALERTKRRLSD